MSALFLKTADNEKEHAKDVVQNYRISRNYVIDKGKPEEGSLSLQRAKIMSGQI